MRRCNSETRHPVHIALICVLLLGIPSPGLNAAVVGIEIEQRTDVLDGRTWADSGAYEKLSGKDIYAFDPENPANEAITDLKLAPRKEDRSDEAWADLVVLQPKDPARRRGIGWIEVSNRGSKASLAYFNRGTGDLNPVTAEHFGDGLLMDEGLTVIWVGWQWDVPETPEALLNLHVPVAQGLDGAAVSGLVRADWAVDTETELLGLSDRCLLYTSDAADERVRV